MLRFGIVGCGAFVEGAVLPMMQNVENARAVAACGGKNKQRVKRVCAQFGIVAACESFEDLISRDDVDAVYIASPNVFHKDQAIAAARAGKHVLCEKPMGMNAAECREMVRVCRERGVKLGVGFCYRFSGGQQRAKALIRESAIGDVSYLYLSWNLSGFCSKEAGWRCDPRISGGGPLMNLAPHLVDLGCFFVEDRVQSAMGYVRPARSNARVESDALAILEFSGGARASIDTSFVRGNKHNYTVVGSEGQIHAVGTMGWQAGGSLTLQVHREEHDVQFQRVEGIEQEFRLFSRAIELDEEPPVPGEAGLHAQAVIDAIYESGRGGTRCKVRAYGG